MEFIRIFLFVFLVTTTLAFIGFIAGLIVGALSEQEDRERMQ